MGGCGIFEDTVCVFIWQNWGRSQNPQWRWLVRQPKFEPCAFWTPAEVVTITPTCLVQKVVVQSRLYSGDILFSWFPSVSPGMLWDSALTFMFPPLTYIPQQYIFAQGMTVKVVAQETSWTHLNIVCKQGCIDRFIAFVKW